MDLLQAGVTVGLFVAVQGTTYLVRKGRSQQKEVNLEEKVGEHGERLDDHDKQLAALPQTFVQRAELNQTLSDIRSSQNRTEDTLTQTLLHLARNKGKGEHL